MLPIALSFPGLVRLLHESVIFCVIKINARGELTYMNDHFSRVYAHLYQGQKLRRAELAVHPIDRDASKATLFKCIKSPLESFPVNLKMVDKTERHIAVSWEYRANIERSGAVDGVIGIGMDMTALESSKDHIQDLNILLHSVALQQSHAVRRPLANLIGLINLLTEVEGNDNSFEEILNHLKSSADELIMEFDSFMIRNF